MPPLLFLRLPHELWPGRNVRREVDGLPVNNLPPRLSKRLLTAAAADTEPIVTDPCVLPCVEAQERYGVQCARRLRSRSLGRGAALEVLVGGAAQADGVHVGALEAPVGARVRGSREVSREDAVVLVACLDEPDEARAEHGGGGEDHFAAEGVDGGEGVGELGGEGFGHGFRVRGDVLEEEVGVVRHGGVVEDGGLGGVLG